MPDYDFSNYIVKQPKGYDDLIEKHAAAHGVDPDLVRAVIHQESGGRKTARSPVGAEGLMQLMPGTARRFKVSDPYDPDQNIGAGTQYLRFLLDRYKGDVPKALAGYNAGEGNVDKYNGIPPFKETRNYVKTITANYRGGGYAQSPDFSKYIVDSPAKPEEKPVAQGEQPDFSKYVIHSLPPPQQGQSPAPAIQQGTETGASVPTPSPAQTPAVAQPPQPLEPNPAQTQPLPQTAPGAYRTGLTGKQRAMEQVTPSGRVLSRGGTVQLADEPNLTAADIALRAYRDLGARRGLDPADADVYAREVVARMPPELLANAEKARAEGRTDFDLRVPGSEELLNKRLVVAHGDAVMGARAESRQPEGWQLPSAADVAAFGPVASAASEALRPESSSDLAAPVGIKVGAIDLHTNPRDMVTARSTVTETLDEAKHIAANLAAIPKSVLTGERVGDIDPFGWRKEVERNRALVEQAYKEHGGDPTTGEKLLKGLVKTPIPLAKIGVLAEAVGGLPRAMALLSFAENMDRGGGTAALEAYKSFLMGKSFDMTSGLDPRTADMAQGVLGFTEAKLSGASTADAVNAGIQQFAIGRAIAPNGHGETERPGEQARLPEAIKPEGDPRVLGDLTRRLPETREEDLNVNVPVGTVDGVRVVKGARVSETPENVSTGQQTQETATPEPVRHVDLQKRDEASGEFAAETEAEKAERRARVNGETNGTEALTETALPPGLEYVTHPKLPEGTTIRDNGGIWDVKLPDGTRIGANYNRAQAIKNAADKYTATGDFVRDAATGEVEYSPEAITETRDLNPRPEPTPVTPEAGAAAFFKRKGVPTPKIVDAELVDKSLSRNYRAGSNDATLTFSSTEQRDLYDLGAKMRYLTRGGQDRTSKRAVGDIQGLREGLSNRLNLSGPEVSRLAMETYNDVKGQMRGVKHLEERKVADNVRPSDVGVGAPVPGGGVSDSPEGGRPDRLNAAVPGPRAFRAQIKSKFNLSDEKADAVSAVAEGFAKYWAENHPEAIARGARPEDWYQRFGGIEKGGETSEPVAARQGNKAAVEFLKDGRAVLRAFQKADVSSAWHELAHVFRRDLTPELLKDAETSLGVKDGNWTRDHDEKFARGFERYLKTGEAPTVKLRRVFEQAKQWLTDIYGAVRGKSHALSFKPNEQLVSVFDRMLGGAPKGEHGKLINLLHKAPDDGTPSFFENAQVKRALGLKADASTADVRAALTEQIGKPRSSHLSPEDVQGWVESKKLGGAARVALDDAVAKYRGVTKAPTAYEQTGIRKSNVNPETQSLSEFVRAMGGIRLDRDRANRGELESLSNKESGSTGIVRRDGMSVHDMAQAAAEAGYPVGSEGGYVRRDLMGQNAGAEEASADALVELLGRDLSGDKVYSHHREVDYDKLYREQNPDDNTDALDEFLGIESNGILYDKVADGTASRKEVEDFKRLAAEGGVFPEHVAALIRQGKRAKAEGVQGSADREGATDFNFGGDDSLDTSDILFQSDHSAAARRQRAYRALLEAKGQGTLSPDLKTEPVDPNVKAKERLEASIADLERRIAEGDIAVKRRSLKAVPEDVAQLRQRRDALQKQLGALKRSMPVQGPRLSEAQGAPEGPRMLDITPADHLRTPLSNLTFKGVYERVGGIAGKRVSDLIREAQNDHGTAETLEVKREVVQRLRRLAAPHIKQVETAGMRGLAEMMRTHLDQIAEVPTRFDRAVGSLIRQTPGLRNHVESPDRAFKNLASRLTSIQSALRLRYNIKSATVNLLDPLTTLWPFVTTKDFAGLYADFLKPSTRQMLRERGVIGHGGSKAVEGVETKRSSFSPFEKASEVNRGVGYLYGYRKAISEGEPEAEAHQAGEDWARKVEFDNSQWNAPSILRNNAGRIFLQFKGYTLKSFENIGQVVGSDAPGSRSARIAKFTAGKGLAGGVNAVSKGVKYLGAGYAMVALAGQLQKAGMSEDEAKRWTRAVFYGAPALVGLDLSGSVAVVDDVPGDTFFEKAGNFLMGPTVGTGVNLAGDVRDLATAKDNKNPTPETGETKTASDKRKESAIRFAKHLTPYARMAEGAYDLATQGGNVKAKAGKEEVELNQFESVMRALGFTPAKVSEAYDVPESDSGTGERLSPTRARQKREERARPARSSR